jgi:hypothetical protein
MMSTIEKRFDIQIATKGQTVTGKFELDKMAKVIKGIKITSDREDLLFYRGTQKIEINGKERFEENYESKNLQCSLNVDVNNRYKDMQDTETGNGSVVITYTDNAHPLYAFSAYRVSLYVQYEI